MRFPLLADIEYKPSPDDFFQVCWRSEEGLSAGTKIEFFVQTLGMAEPQKIREEAHDFDEGGLGYPNVKLKPWDTQGFYHYGIFLILCRFVDGDSISPFSVSQKVSVPFI